MSNLTASSVICMLCYKYFQSVMQQLRPIGMPTTGVSTNDFIPLVQCCHKKIQLHRSKGRDIGKDEVYVMIYVPIGTDTSGCNEGR